MYSGVHNVTIVSQYEYIDIEKGKTDGFKRREQSHNELATQRTTRNCTRSVPNDSERMLHVYDVSTERARDSLSPKSIAMVNFARLTLLPFTSFIQNRNHGHNLANEIQIVAEKKLRGNQQQTI
jgi:hypothetical protein